MFSHCPTLREQHPNAPNATDIYDRFVQYKARVPVCGAIIINEALDKCLLVKSWGKAASWGFPKGKFNKNEAELECAIREVRSDCTSYLLLTKSIHRLGKRSDSTFARMSNQTTTWKSTN